MPRTRVQKPDRNLKSTSTYERAYEQVLCGQYVRGAVKEFGLCHVSLMRYKRKRESKAKEENADQPFSMAYNSHTRVSSAIQEVEMPKYIMKAVDIHFGLSPKEIRRLAYELTDKYHLKAPWATNKIAGEDGFSGFMKRHKDSSMRCAQASSLSRATSFNRTNVKAFYDNLSRVMDREKFAAKDIFNIDETGVQKPNRVVAKQGIRQVGALTYGERGSLVTVTIAASAIGNYVPPMFFFPRIRYQDHFIRDGPIRCMGTGNSSVWMQESEFVMFLKHFQNHVNPSVDRKVLLLLDNHSSHITIEALDFCKANGIVMLSFPPHRSHKLQSLDRSVFGPYKKTVNSASDCWMRSNSGKAMSIYDIPSILSTVLPSALTQTNIQAGFKCTGLYSFNADIFTDIDFAPSYITDRPIPMSPFQDTPSNQMKSTNKSRNIWPQPEFVTTAIPEPENSRIDEEIPEIPNPTENNMNIDTSKNMMIEQIVTNQNTPSTSRDIGATTNTIAFSPDYVRPFPKAGPRKNTNRGKTKRKSTVITDTPEKDAIRSESEARENKKRAQMVKRNITNVEGEGKEKNIAEKKSRVECPETSDDENLCYCLVCMESYGSSKPGEQWLQCSDCKFWAHEECTPQSFFSYVCHNCESE